MSAVVLPLRYANAPLSNLPSHSSNADFLIISIWTTSWKNTKICPARLRLSGTTFAALSMIRGGHPDLEGEVRNDGIVHTLREERAMATKTASDVMKFAKDSKVEIVDLKFCDVPGLWQPFSVSANEFSEEVFEDGIGFDGSSIRGFQTIDESDMLLIPDPESAFLDPFADV